MRYCSVPQCSQKSVPGISFHGFPKEPKLLKQWSIVLKMGKPVTSGLLVCSRHFDENDYNLPGVPSKKLYLKKGAVPSKNLPVGSVRPKQTHSPLKRAREARAKALDLKRRPSLLPCPSTHGDEPDDEPGPSMPGPSAAPLPDDEPVGLPSEPPLPDDDPIPFAEALLELGKSLPRRSGSTADKACLATPSLIDAGKLSFFDVIRTEKQLRAFTGIPNLGRFNKILHVVDILEKKERKDAERKLSCRDRLLLCLIKLKLNLSFACLSALFAVSSFSCSRFFKDMVMRLAKIMKRTIKFPSMEEIKRNLPKCFAKFQTTRIVLDCTEVAIQKTNCLKCRIQTYSHYKGGQTMKVLIGAAPSGLITYVGPAYGGRSSDKALFLASGLLDMVKPKESIMVDKGFHIEQECLQRGINLIRPPFKESNRQMTEQDAYRTAAVAAARVHIERCIQRCKIFKILKHEFPFQLLQCCDDIMVVIAGLVNLGSPILSKDKFLS